MEERLNQYRLKDLFSIAKKLGIKYVKSYGKIINLRFLSFFTHLILHMNGSV